MTRLSVNVDHVATLRQARGTDYPNPAAAARIAEEAGASGITIHLRGDRRHIQDDDVLRLRESVQGKLNLEMAATTEMLDRAVRFHPDQVTLVPERPEEITTEGGLDLKAQGEKLLPAAERLAAAGISVSVFVDPEPFHVDWLTRRSGGPIAGFEINTDRYSRLTATAREAALTEIQKSAAMGASAGLQVYAGHALTTANVGPIAATPEIEELNIGHFLVSRAILVGMAKAVQEMLAAMAGSSAVTA